MNIKISREARPKRKKKGHIVSLPLYKNSIKCKSILVKKSITVTAWDWGRGWRNEGGREKELQIWRND